MSNGRHGGSGQRPAAPAARVDVVVGLGATGLAAAEYLHARGQPFAVIDSREAPPGLAELTRRVPGADVDVGRLDPAWLERARRLIVSPGLAPDLPLLAAARALGVPLVSDIEVFAQEAFAPVIAVTGSNGKSTVTTLVAAILEQQGFDAPAGGNLGPPALTLLERAPVDAYVLEISSFQMELTDSLRPRAAAVLNLSPDHLDRHGTLEAYAALKAKLLMAAEVAVYNHDDARVRAMAASHPNAMPYSTREPLEHGYSLVEHGGGVWLARDLAPLLPAAGLPFTGTHMLGNALAALALSEPLGGDADAACTAIERFSGLPHRCERVADVAGVVYVDDSKGTNVGATIAAVDGLAGPTILIAGGLAKGADLAALADAVADRLKGAVLIGAAAEALERAFAGRCPTERAASLDAAVERAAALAAPGDTVLLSPACASFDMFRDYADRGDAFKRAVRSLAR